MNVEEGMSRERRWSWRSGVGLGGEEDERGFEVVDWNRGVAREESRRERLGGEFGKKRTRVEKVVSLGKRDSSWEIERREGRVVVFLVSNKDGRVLTFFLSFFARIRLRTLRSRLRSWTTSQHRRLRWIRGSCPLRMRSHLELPLPLHRVRLFHSLPSRTFASRTSAYLSSFFVRRCRFYRATYKATAAAKEKRGGKGSKVIREGKNGSAIVTEK